MNYILSLITTVFYPPHVKQQRQSDQPLIESLHPNRRFSKWVCRGYGSRTDMSYPKHKNVQPLWFSLTHHSLLDDSKTQDIRMGVWYTDPSNHDAVFFTQDTDLRDRLKLFFDKHQIVYSLHACGITTNHTDEFGYDPRIFDTPTEDRTIEAVFSDNVDLTQFDLDVINQMVCYDKIVEKNKYDWEFQFEEGSFAYRFIVYHGYCSSDKREAFLKLVNSKSQ